MINIHVGYTLSVEDGATLKVVQIKNRDGEDWVTYEISMAKTLPRRYVMRMSEFQGVFSNVLK